MCQFTEPWLAKEIAGVTDCKNKEHVFNAGIFFFSSSLPDMAGKELRATEAEERNHTQPVAGGKPFAGRLSCAKRCHFGNYIGSLGDWITCNLHPL